MAEPLSIDLAGAQEALEEAGGMPETVPVDGGDPFQYNRDESGRFASKPDESATPVVDDAQEQTPEPAATPDEGTEAEVAFTHIDDSVLTPEMLQLKRSLQADYTRKTQEVAPWRKLGEELGVESPDDFRDALEVYTRLQDPRNWPQIHTELAQYMQEYGMTPAQAREAAADQLSTFAPAEEVDDFSDYEGDDDIAPIVQQMRAQSQQIQQLKEMMETERQQSQHQAQLRALAEGMTKQEQAIRQQNPHYTDDEIETIYNFMGEDGNLFAAQQKFEGLIGARVSRYLASKTGAQQSVPSPVPGPGVIASEEADVPEDLDAGHRAALAHVAALDREEATS